MIKGKRILCALVAVSMLMCFMLTGCGEGKDSNTTVSSKSNEENTGGSDNSEETSPAYAVILKTAESDYWQTMKSGIEKEAKKQGVSVDIYFADGNNDTEGQLGILEDCLKKGYKAIGVSAVSPTNLVDGIIEAGKNDVYIMLIDEKIDMDAVKKGKGSVLALAATDNEKVGKMGAEYIIDKLENGGEVAIIEGKGSDDFAKDRTKGAKDTFEKEKNIRLVDTQSADWDRQKSAEKVTEIMSKNPNLKAIYCANDEMALGAVDAVKKANKQGKIIVVGSEGTKEAVESIENGELTATIALDSAKVGSASLEQMIKAVEEEKKVDSEDELKTIKIDPYIIDSKD